MYDLVERMKQLGFTMYEALVYLTLWRDGAMSAGDLAKSAGIPYNRCYDVLASLSGRGFVEEVGRAKKLFSAIEPEIAFMRLSKEVEELKEGVKRLERAGKNGESMERLRSREEFAKALELLAKRAEYELTIVAPSSVLSDVKTEATLSLYTDERVDFECDLLRKITQTSNIIVMCDVDEVLVFPAMAMGHDRASMGFLSSFPEIVFSYYVHIRDLFYSSELLNFRQKEKMSFAVLYHFLDAVKRSKRERAKVLLGSEWIDGRVEGVTLDGAVNSFMLNTEGKIIRIGGPYSLLEESEARAEILL